MSEPADNPNATPDESTHSVPKAIHLIHREFQNLANKSEDYAPWNPSCPSVPVDTNHEMWNGTLNRLQFKIIPPLRQQINSLPKLLNPAELREDTNGSKLQPIAELQSDLDQSLDQVFSIAGGIKNIPVSSPAQADDNDSKEFKEYRRHGLAFQITCLVHRMRLTFYLCSRTIGDLKKPTKVTSRSDQIRQLTFPCKLMNRTTRATDVIDCIIKWITSNEFILIQEHWDPELSALDDHIADLTQLIKQALDRPEPEENGDVSDPLARRINRHAIPLAQSLIPVIKLSRLFFRKLAKEALNKRPSKPFTDMSSFQLNTLSESAGDANFDFSDILKLLLGTDETVDTAESITQIIHKLIRHFDSNLLLVIMFIIPLLPNPIASPNDLQNSLVVWNSLFLIAAHNCIRAAKAYKAATRPAEPPAEPQE
ncbi:hypothetical protein PCASD_15096 [Puccinia coronata f. sp. avenae]|uniref:Uncharacterized protein n=1 Tax=Puccinia coronata f. sp. avenae TaxID=200324 RepID=A0A2N5T6B1_9BASI|nr:hypothetical protein PCASD_15096 [Puccinia coronata f. sp. avenae]